MSRRLGMRRPGEDEEYEAMLSDARLSSEAARTEADHWREYAADLYDTLRGLVEWCQQSADPAATDAEPVVRAQAVLEEVDRRP